MLASDPQSTREVVRRAAQLIMDRMPEGWTSAPGVEQRGQSGVQADMSMDVRAPDGKHIRFLLEGKKVVDRRDVPQIAERMRANSGPGDVLILAGRYLPPSVREALVNRGISYVDATGNMRITSSDPAVYLADRGEDRDPWRGPGRPRGTLKGEPAARVVRALLDYRKGWRVRDLIETSGASTGATYRVLDYLQLQGLVLKENGKFGLPNWEQLLREWSRDCPLATTNHIAKFLEPRGVQAFEARLTDTTVERYAVTGSFAAQEWVQYASTKAVYVYVPSIETAAEEWELRPNETAPNVILVEPTPTNDVAFRNTTKSANGITLAAIPQVAADLLNGSGREPAEGEALIEWMLDNESLWRHG
ncbi:MAG: hypothetical protein IT190_04250 [Microbacteriaceae bacterium]|nr:hypothetical protein [Microbacteriaceae bacterium]